MKKSIRSIKDIFNYSLNYEYTVLFSKEFLKFLKTDKPKNLDDYIVYSKRNDNNQIVIYFSYIKDYIVSYDYFINIIKNEIEKNIKDDFLRSYKSCQLSKCKVIYARYKGREKSFRYLEDSNFDFELNKNGEYIESILYNKTENFSFDFKQESSRFYEINEKKKNELKKIKLIHSEYLKVFSDIYNSDAHKIAKGFYDIVNIDGFSFYDI